MRGKGTPASLLHYSLRALTAEAEGDAGAFVLRATRWVRAKKKRRFRGEYPCVCLSHVQKPEGAGVCGAFPEAVHARKSWEEPGMGGTLRGEAIRDTGDGPLF